MGKSTISMAIFNSYVKLPEGKLRRNACLSFSGVTSSDTPVPLEDVLGLFRPLREVPRSLVRVPWRCFLRCGNVVLWVVGMTEAFRTMKFWPRNLRIYHTFSSKDVDLSSVFFGNFEDFMWFETIVVTERIATRDLIPIWTDLIRFSFVYKLDRWTNEWISSGWWFQTFFIFHFIYGMSSFPLTNSYFSRWLKPPTSHSRYGVSLCFSENKVPRVPRSPYSCLPFSLAKRAIGNGLYSISRLHYIIPTKYH